MRFLPGDSSVVLCELREQPEQRRTERWERARWRLHAHRKQPRADLSKYPPEGQPRQDDGAHQTSVQESQGNKNAHSPTRE